MDIKDTPVLIVDDYRTMLRIIRNFLSQIGFNDVDEAMDGRSAIGKIRDKDYGLVIADWNMEPMNGLMLLKEIRLNDKTKDLPFIMVSSQGGMTMATAKEAGANSYILKPFNVAGLKGKLASVLGSF